MFLEISPFPVTRSYDAYVSSTTSEAKNVNQVHITMSAPVYGQPLPTDARTGSDASTEVTGVVWTGQTYIAEQVKRDLAATVSSVPLSEAPSYTAPCAAGKMGSGTWALTLNHLNLLRSLAGTNYTVISEDLMEEA